MFRVSGIFVVTLVVATNAFDGSRLDEEVIFANVVFRHGDRAPDANGMELFPTDPYLKDSFFPEGLGGLTNHGKKREFELGKQLRSLYDNFLGKLYMPDDVVARSTDYKRTKMSLALVLAGLFPPEPLQRWSDIPWQPIPTTYVTGDDDLLIPELCPRYLEEFERVKLLPEVVEQVENFRPTMDTLTNLTGKLVNTTNDMYYLYHDFMAEHSLGLPLIEWAYEIFPDGLLFDGTVLEYDIVSYNTMLKRLNGGTLLKRFIDDMVAAKNGMPREARKINLFSGHETNVAALLQTLGVYEPHVPEYSSAVVVELVKIGDGYYVRVLHYLGIPAKFEVVMVPGCHELCPINVFIDILRDVTATNDDLGCGKNNTSSRLS